ncbi:unnamed protein product [Ilex paraguariensis]|uniref:Uncharacterized protein n=1 Tax=Ilex paraguariensis TaxID=185542 RepID=A0ABC8UGV5_9AQUA
MADLEMTPEYLLADQNDRERKEITNLMIQEQLSKADMMDWAEDIASPRTVPWPYKQAIEPLNVHLAP